MTTNVDLERFRHLGSEGQVPVRRPSGGNGFEWVDPSLATVRGQATVDFGNGPPATQSVTVTVVDGQVTTASNIQISVQIGIASGSTQRDADELEMDQVDARIGVITPSVGYTVVVSPSSAGSQPHGKYLLNYARF